MNYKLKEKDELIEMLKTKNITGIIICKKCFVEYKYPTKYTKECEILLELLNSLNKQIDFCLTIDFLCNEDLNIKKLEGVKGEIGVLSCGFGFQVLSKILEGQKLFILSDAVPENGYHGLSLFEKRCNACGQCYLNLTGGVCPIVECSKSLVNGPCGGSKEGYCEVKINGEKKKCGWEQIYKKLSLLNNLSKFLSAEIKNRNFSVTKYSELNEMKISIVKKRKEGFYGGCYPRDMKEMTKDKPIQKFKEPEVVVVPLQQHTGEICKPLVKVNDYVKFGQKIADSDSRISSPIHSSVSGKVIDIKPYSHPTLLRDILAIVIESDGKNIPDESITPIADYESMQVDKLREVIHQKGVVGLGGAMFPTHIKLAPPKSVDVLIINGCECEPYLNSDYRIMVEKTDELITGIKIMMKILSVKKCLIGIEDNKPEAVRKISTAVATDNGFEVCSLKTKYPQGAERMLIKRLLNREVPKGKLPFEVGVVVQNVSTAYAVYEAVVLGSPLVKRVITVAGDECVNPGNYEMKVGMLLNEVVKTCFMRYDFDSYELFHGGVMMGIKHVSLDTPIIKGTTGIILRKKSDIEKDVSRSCIRCGRCVDVCPMELIPSEMYVFIRNSMFNEAKEAGVFDCIECGCCDYICSSKLPLVDQFKYAKSILLGKA